MPLSRYDKWHGGKGGAQKALSSLIDQYGTVKGRRVFYALTAKRKREGHGGLSHQMGSRAKRNR